jgi:cytochrome c553
VPLLSFLSHTIDFNARFITFGKDITVHHIDGNGKNNIVKEKNNSLENLVTLCLKCHGAEDSKRQFVKL